MNRLRLADGSTWYVDEEDAKRVLDGMHHNPVTRGKSIDIALINATALDEQGDGYAEPNRVLVENIISCTLGDA